MLAKIRYLARRLRFRRLHTPNVRYAFRIVGTDYGGWPVIPSLLPREPLIYSFGTGEDVSFDLGMISQFGARVHGFDPTPRSAAWIAGQQLPASFTFHSIGIADQDGEIPFFPPADAGHVSFSNAPSTAQRGEPVMAPVRRLGRIMEELGHDAIDILKMDIEGFEYGVIDDIARSQIRPQLILVEFHHNMYQSTDQDTISATERLMSIGYDLFHVSATGHEYGFVCRTS